MSAKTLNRSRDDRWVGGVCGGLAEYTGLDSTVIRLIAVVATILGAGSLIVIYLICWVFIPAPPRATGTEPQPPSTSSR